MLTLLFYQFFADSYQLCELNLNIIIAIKNVGIHPKNVLSFDFMFHIYFIHLHLRGGGQTFFRAFINSELGSPEVAPCMARTFGGVSGHRRQTGSEPRPAQIWSQK